MDDLKLNGLGIALATPFKRDFSIDYEALGKMINHTVSGGCDYIVALGTTAETPTLTVDEKQKVAKFIKEKNAGKVPLVLGIGGNCTDRVIKDISTWDLTGYSAILSVTPYYNKPTQEGLYQHFKTISEVSPLPLILYNVPGRTGVNLTAETTLRLSLLINIVGIKEASGKLDQIKKIIKEGPDKFFVISGNDGDTTEVMKMGGNGVISVFANAMPDLMKKLVKLCQGKKWSQAESLQSKMGNIIKHLFEEGNPAGVKVLLNKLGICENTLRLPLVQVSKYMEEKLISELSYLLSNDL